MRWVIRWYLRRVLAQSAIRKVDWTEEERASFDNFCRSSAGLKLFEFLRQLCADVTFNAVYHNSVSANARARGMQDLLGVLHRLRVFPNQEESNAQELEADLNVEPPAKGATNQEAIDWFNYPGGTASSIDRRK